MTRWHSSSCQSPIVWVGEDSVPRCKTCGASAHRQLQQLREHPTNPVPPLPPNEKAGQLNLYWPPSVPYTRKKSTALTGEIQDSLRISDTPSKTPKSLIYGRTLETDEFRLICLTAEEKDLPPDVVHLSLETYSDDNFPDYEAVSYTWGGEDGDGTLRHPVYINEHWDILPQTRNCYAMLRYLRPWRGIRMVWVDAICINQKDVQERGYQVAKMGQIFTRCSQVFLWLGDDIAFKKPGVHPPRLPLHELESLKKLQLPGRTKRVDIQSLFKRRYFSRVWVIQELILPPRIVIPIGDKIFGVDSSTATHFERLSRRHWRWNQTRAPWFQHATRGLVMRENLLDLLKLTWKSQSSDIRDKLYGVMGLSMNEGIQIRPNYGISLQHLLIGFFAHCIISRDTPTLLYKAAGASAEAGMPSWMPPWKGDAWWDLFSSNSEQYSSKQQLSHSLASMRDHMEMSSNPYQPTLNDEYRLTMFTSSDGGGGFRKTVLVRRPWHQGATVDADNGAMSLNLTRLMSIENRPVRAEIWKEGFQWEGWYKIECTRQFWVVDYIYMMSRSQLDKVVEAGDEFFLLDINVGVPIYLILRKAGNHEDFRLIAVCPQLAFFSPTRSTDSVPSWEWLPLGDLQETLHTDLTRLRGFYDHDISNGARDWVQVSRKQFLFPGRRGEIMFKEVLSLLLGIARDKHKHKFKSQKGFQELYLESIDPKFQPRASNGFCELTLDAEDREEINNLVLPYPYHVRGIEGWIKMEGWTKGPAKEDANRVVIRRNMSIIERELKSMVSGMRSEHYLSPVDLLDSLVDRLEDVDVGERIMAGPVEEDHFRGGTHLGLDPVFRRFGLDGSTFNVRIV